jgi:3'-phosphoadenosine 5'-phosphosulfate sulfotransferase (PAPS reductase)/FAD synthetase
LERKKLNELPRDAEGIAHIVGLSGGKDSVCMALMLMEREPRPYVFYCTPTGDELPEMIEHWKRLETILGQPILHITNGTLKSCIAQNNMLPNFRSRFCTRLLKLKPAGEFFEKIQPAVSYVGLRADEEEREGTRPGGDSAAIGTKVTQNFPLVRFGMDLKAVLAYLAERGIEIPERTDCARCPYQKLGEWYNLWLKYPDIYLDAEQDEADHGGHTYRSPDRDSWPAALKGLRELFEQGIIPDRSLNMMAKRQGMCSACTR